MGEENPFTEAEARLGAMHGYAAVTDAGGVGDPWPCEDCRRVMRLEAKVDALILALRSGAVGKWTP